MDSSTYDIQPCSLCNGDGTSLDSYPCHACQGTGTVLALDPTFEQIKEHGDRAMEDAKELEREIRKIQEWLNGSKP